MFYGLKTAIRFRKLNSQIGTIVDTPPVSCERSSNVVCVSHIGKRYLYMYLLALKSLARKVPLKKVIIIDDESLTDGDKALLAKHIVGVDIRPISSVSNSKCPSGGDWEGFLLIGDEVENSYCVLLDADTVVTGEVPELVDSIANNRSFTLGTWKNQEIEPVAQTYEHVKAVQSSHVQMVAEKTLRELPNAGELKYVRGCGGFAGFAKGKSFRRDIEDFSGKLDALIGKEKWKEWGSQQVASNYIVANTPGTVVLPFPKYASYAPGVNTDACAFVHFIGSHRFDGTKYADVGRKVIGQLGER